MSRSRRGTRERARPTSSSRPPSLVLAGVALYPILAAVWLSLHRMILVFHDRRFIGLDNYAFMLQRRAVLERARQHGVFHASSRSAIELALGLGFALLLDARVDRPRRSCARPS